jgi:sugar phosphate isomerase/epimerase
MNYTRRDLGKIALATLPAARLLAKPNSKFNGVQIGINAPYCFRGMPGSAEDILRYMIQLNLSAVELRAQPVEAYLGAPGIAAAGRGAAAGKKTGGPTPEQQAAQRAAAEELRKWRLSVSLDKFQAFRKKYEDAGVLIEIVKFDGMDSMTDDVIDYCFQMAKALGAKAISCEPPLSHSKRIGTFATQHRLMVGYHGHANMTNPEAFAKPESWETAMSYSKFNGANIDLGHFLAGNNVSPIPFLRKYHDRITHIHLKDRKLNQGPNVPWGQGDTPIKEVLQLMRKEKYQFQATIEFEYPTPEGSDVMKELAKCVQFCKDALV